MEKCNCNGNMQLPVAYLTCNFNGPVGNDPALLTHNEVTTLNDEILPGAKEAFNAATKIYRLGKLDLLGLLDAQRTYFETRQQHIESVKEYHRIVIAIERLIGSSLSEGNDYIAEEAIR